ncbi:Pulcherriminic acid synthase [Halomicronema hongdechloris C2206]|uniref:Pulcherriminic acid synthase n=2 Tax=Halomicronema hongdechloris TaxID=1209493 RepID=A0A1Z3HQN0_9CYAN|nr:Pulcherriminic acid synthase [Halomicronema hongdechloris C2206]
MVYIAANIPFYEVPIIMSYLEQYDNIPMDRLAEKLQLVNQWIRTEWRPFFQELRENRPIFVTPKFTLVTLFSDVQEVLSRENVFTVKLYASKMDAAVEGPFMLARDNTEINWREKSIMKTMLQPEDLPAVRKMAGDIAKTSLDNHAQAGEIEVVSQLGRYVPVRVCGDYFGFPGPDLESMYRWSRATQTNFFKNLPNDPQIHEAAVQAGREMTTYLTQLLAEKQAQVTQTSPQNLSFGDLLRALLDKLFSGNRSASSSTPPEPNAMDDVFTRLVKTQFADDILFDDKRIVTNMAGLLIGAVETTSQAIVQALEQILLTPTILQEALQAAQANDDETFDRYVWEALRFNPINPLVFRLCEQDYVLAAGTPRETPIPANSLVFACTASAGFDAHELPQPETFSIDRLPYHYMHFGYGHHTCLGKYVGMMQIPETIKQVLLRPGVRLLPGDAGKIDFQGTPFPERFVIAYDR